MNWMHSAKSVAAVLPVATNDAFFHPVPPRADLTCEVLVIARVHPDRVAPVKALVGAFDTHVYGEGWDEHGVPGRGLIFGDDVLAALNSARISVVFFLTGGGHALVKVGLFDFPAAGALVATNYFPEVEPYLTYGKEIIGFTSTDDLVRKVRYYLDHPAEADAIRAAGRARVRRDHTWRTAWPRILEELRQ